MYKVDDADAAADMPAPSGPSNPGWFQEGNPGTGTPATVIRADWLNGVTAELLSILTAAAITPAKNAFNQVLMAILTLIQSGSGSAQDDTGAADAYVITPTPSIAAYTRYQRFTFKAAHANTGTSTLNVNALGTKAIVRPDGNPLQAGDIAVGMVVTVRYDGGAFQLATPWTVKTPPVNDNTTKPANTAWIWTNILALVNSVVGSVTGVTAPANDNTTKLATTAWVWTNIQALVASVMASVTSAAGFVLSTGTVGYVKFPSWLGGFIIQWQSGTVSAGNTIAWPVAFPTSVVGALAIPNSASTTTYGINIAANTTTGATLYPNTGGGGATIVLTLISFGY